MTESSLDYTALMDEIRDWSAELGFQQLAVTDTDLSSYTEHYQNWLANNYHGAMEYMANNTDKRLQPEQLVEGTARIIVVRMDYALVLDNEFTPMSFRDKAYVARYARGRDYHKLIRNRLQKLADKIEERVGPFGYRAFVDSAPVLERALAEKSGLGWIGKNTMLINKDSGSWFFLGELFTDLPLPLDEPASEHCGSCRACLDVCPTDAFVGPNELDSRKCISYLTIELHDSIPVELRKPMGNRIFGCDDCQLICPWNKFTKVSGEDDFQPRHNLDDSGLVTLFHWTEQDFLEKTEGSAIRRIGYECWLRNIAVALGNAESSDAIIAALWLRLEHDSSLVREHVEWALAQHIEPV